MNQSSGNLERGDRRAGTNRTLSLRIGVTLAALALAALHLWHPELQIDSITVALMVIALLPWAQPLIKSVELLGVKLELQDLKNEVADAKGAAASAQRKADFLTAPVPTTSSSAPSEIPTSTDVAYAQLMRDYENIRSVQSPGPGRTEAMTAVVRQMTELAPSLQSFDVAAALVSHERGQRLGAYAYLYARPDARYIEPLVASVTKIEDKPFGQYWGLQAISRILTVSQGVVVSEDARLQLRQYAARVPRGTDRDYEIRKILNYLGVREASD